MDEPLDGVARFFRELKRRNVYRVAVTYAVVGFVLIEAADLIFPALNIPSWAYSLVVVLVLFGFPVALVVAWAYDLTPEGVRRTPSAELEDEAAEPSARRAGGWLVALLVLLLAGGGFWYLTAGGGEEAPAETAAAADTAPATTEAAGPPRVAVLPFENIAPDSAEDYFAEGMHEEVLNQLSKVSGLEVISRTSVMGYADTDKRVPEISEELGGVNALLEGTVRRAGDQVRITTQLIETPEDEHLWSDTYERTLTPEAIFEIQAEIAEQIAGALETQLASGERQRIEDAPTEDLAAYEAYLRGREEVLRFLAQFEPDLLIQGIESLRTAVRRDSAFGEAHAWLGTAYALRPHVSRQDRWVDSASAAVERARSIEPDLAQAHLARAFVNQARDDFSARIEALRRVLELQPSHAMAQAELGEALSAKGRYAEGVRAAHRAVRLDPRRPYVLQEMGDQLRAAGLYDAAEAWDRHTLSIEPGNPHAFDGLANAQRLRGEPEAALETWQRYEARWRPLSTALFLRFAAEAALHAGQPGTAKSYLERIPEARRRASAEGSPSRPDQLGTAPRDRMLLGLAELRLGNRERGRELLQSTADTLQSQLRESRLPPVQAPAPLPAYRKIRLAGAFAALGQEERALRQLEQSREALEQVPTAFLRSPFFHDLRPELRFQDILRELEAKREAARDEIRRMGVDLYPPGAKADSTTGPQQSDG